MLANIPKGRYGIVAIELEGRNITSYYPTHWNQEWSRDQSSEPSVYGRPEDIHSSVEFDTNGIGNFKYIILAPLPGGSPFLDYRGSYYESLEGIRAYSGLNNYKYYRHPVPQYFLDKYPDSEWAPYLRQLLRK